MSTLFKDLYNERYIETISNELKNNYFEFDIKGFAESVFDELWKSRELKERMRHISTTLGVFLPKEYKKAIVILENTFVNIENGYALENMIFQDFVEVYGLDDIDTSLDALEVFTVGSSSEFAIRRFILSDEDTVMLRMRLWAKSENEHIRRLSTEGCRPRLPWAISLPIYKNNPIKVIEILDILKDDKSEYVRKSVANNLNDISKDNPQIVIDLLKSWVGYSKNRDKLLKHGCRTLLKQRNEEVLEFFGLKKATHAKIINESIEADVYIGDELEFSFELHSDVDLGLIRIEYQMEFLRKNGKYSKKIFKILESNISKKTKRIVKKHSFRPISTRVYYVGEHRLSIVINGEIKKELVFNLC